MWVERLIVVHADSMRTVVRGRDRCERGIEAIVIGIERELRRIITGYLDRGTD